MANRLAEKVALVSGGGRGIGRAVAHLLAEEGASVVVNDLGCEVDGTGSSHEFADRVAQEIKGRGGKAVATYENVATIAGGENVVKAAVSNFGRLDILVNSAGVLRDRMIFEMSEEDWWAVVQNTMKATFTVTKHACILFRQQRSGRIVNLTSDAGLGEVGRSNYAAASEGIVGLTRTVARDVGRYGVTCNAVSPLARTRLFSGLVEMYRRPGVGPTPDEVAGITSPSPTLAWEGPGSPNDPENVAPLVVYLCTDAAPHVNGYVFGVRGGSVFLYTNPQVERSIYKLGPFTVEELDEMVPRTLALGL